MWWWWYFQREVRGGNVRKGRNGEGGVRIVVPNYSHIANISDFNEM